MLIRLVTGTVLAQAASNDRAQKTMWKAWSTLAAVGAGLATRNLVQKMWVKQTGEEPPQNPGDPSVGWHEALAWSAGLGVGVGVARTLGQRGAAKAWTKATGELPPGFARSA